MGKYIFKIFLLTCVLSIGFTFTSCETDDYDRIRTEFDYSMYPPVGVNGNFMVTNTIYLSDINSKSGINNNIYDIDVEDAWMQVETDDKYGFSRGDQVAINRIIVNGMEYLPDYYVNVNSALEGSGYISFKNDPTYVDFMYNAMKILRERGRIDVTVYGYSSMYAGNLYIVLVNNLNLLVDDYR